MCWTNSKESRHYIVKSKSEIQQDISIVLVTWPLVVDVDYFIVLRSGIDGRYMQHAGNKLIFSIVLSILSTTSAKCLSKNYNMLFLLWKNNEHATIKKNLNTDYITSMKGSYRSQTCVYVCTWSFQRELVLRTSLKVDITSNDVAFITSSSLL
jgi:hypothetical protein